MGHHHKDLFLKDLKGKEGVFPTLKKIKEGKKNICHLGITMNGVKPSRILTTEIQRRETKDKIDIKT